MDEYIHRKMVFILVTIGIILFFGAMVYLVIDDMITLNNRQDFCQEQGMEYGKKDYPYFTCIQIGPNNEIIREVKYYDLP